MSDPQFNIQLLGTIAVLPAFVWGLVAFSRLIQLEYGLYTDDWRRDGRPFVPFMPLTEYRGFRSSIAYTSCSIRWLLHTPRWVMEDPQALTLLRQYRLCSSICLAGIVVMIGGTIFVRR